MQISLNDLKILMCIKNYNNLSYNVLRATSH